MSDKRTTTLPLSECGTIVGGGTPSKRKSAYWNGDIPWITAKEMKCFHLSDSDLKISRLGLNESSAKMIPAGSIIFVVRGSILYRHVPVAVNTVACTINQDMKAVIPRKGILGEYLAYMMLGANDLLMAMVDTAGNSAGKLQTSRWSNLEIPVPPLEEQHRIVSQIKELTRRADEARRIRQKAIQEIIAAQSAFLKNALNLGSHWIETALGKVCMMKTGKTPPTKRKDYFGGDVPFVCPSDLGRSLCVAAADRTLTKEAVMDGKANLFLAGTVLLVGIGSTVGKVGLAERDVCANQQITGLTFNTKVLPSYGAWFLAAQRTAFENAAADGGVPIINQKGMSQIPFSYPPDLREQANIVEQLDAFYSKTNALRQLYSETEAELVAFTRALLAKAFRGEL